MFNYLCTNYSAFTPLDLVTLTKAVVITKNSFFAIKLLVAPLAFLPFRVLLTCNVFSTYTLSNSHLVIVGRGV